MMKTIAYTLLALTVAVSAVAVAADAPASKDLSQNFIQLNDKPATHIDGNLFEMIEVAPATVSSESTTPAKRPTANLICGRRGPALTCF